MKDCSKEQVPLSLSPANVYHNVIWVDQFSGLCHVICMPAQNPAGILFLPPTPPRGSPLPTHDSTGHSLLKISVSYAIQRSNLLHANAFVTEIT